MFFFVFLVKPATVLISGYNRAIHLNDVVSLECKTDHSFPAAEVVWTINETPVEDTDIEERISGNSSKGYVTISLYDVVIGKLLLMPHLLVLILYGTNTSLFMTMFMLSLLTTYGYSFDYAYRYHQYYITMVIRLQNMVQLTIDKN